MPTSSSSSSSSSLSTSGNSGFIKTNVLSAGPIARFRPPSQSISTASISPSTSSNQTRTVSSSALIKNSNGPYTPFGASIRSVSSSFSGSAISASTSPAVSVQSSATQPRTITSGPSIVIRKESWNPTGSAASSQVTLLYGVHFRHHR